MTTPGWGDEWKAGAGEVSIAAIAAQGLKRESLWGWIRRVETRRFPSLYVDTP